MTQAGDDKRLALMIRYQGAADRMFLKCLNELRKLQKERKLEENGSASQTPKTAPVDIAMPKAAPQQVELKNDDLRHHDAKNSPEPEESLLKPAA